MSARYDFSFMNVVAFVARALLVIVFALAATGKLVDRDGARRALSGFRVPQALIQPVSWLLPGTELAVAVLLLVQPVARGAAVAAAALLALFMCGIGAAMRRGEAPDCNCFGQIGSKPAGKATLLRNAGLAVPAIFVAAYGPGVDPGSWLDSGAGTQILVLALVLMAVAMAAAIAGLINERSGLRSDLERSEAMLALFPSGLPIGVTAPGFSLPDTNGKAVTLAGLLALGRPIALTFVSPSCMPCKFMFPDISIWQRSLSERLTIVLVAHGTIDEIQAMATKFHLTNLLSDPDAAVFRAYRGTATPSMLIIDADGRTASRIRSSQGVVEAAIRSALERTPPVAVTAEADTSVIKVERWPGRDVEQPA